MVFSYNLQMKWNFANINYQNTYQEINSCPITDVILSYVETLRRIGNWNLTKENV